MQLWNTQLQTKLYAHNICRKGLQWTFCQVRDGPFLCTYFKNLNNVRISADPPTHPSYYLRRMDKYHGFLRLI